MFNYAVCEGEYVRPTDVPRLFSDYLPNVKLYAVTKPQTFPPPVPVGLSSTLVGPFRARW